MHIFGVIIVFGGQVSTPSQARDNLLRLVFKAHSCLQQCAQQRTCYDGLLCFFQLGERTVVIKRTKNDKVLMLLWNKTFLSLSLSNHSMAKFLKVVHEFINATRDHYS